jgi:hypothetical protein
MLKKMLKEENLFEPNREDISGMFVGRIVKINEEGQVLINCGNSADITAARLTSSVQGKLAKGNPEGREVLLAFENNNPLRPIIVDTIYNIIDEIAEHSTAVNNAGTAQKEIISCARIEMDAGEQIVLQCGKASITLTRAGKILIKGEYVLSSAKGSNKIKGGSIQLN